MRDGSGWRWGLLLWMAVVAGWTVYAAEEGSSYRNLDTRECPILDTPYRTGWELDASYALAAATGTAGWGDDLSMIELNWWVRLFSLENDLGSELETQIRWENRILEGFANASGTDSAYSFSMARLFVQWSQRFVNGYGVQVYSAPGAYTGADGLDGDAFSYPSGARLIKAFTPNVAIFAGATVYPDFETTVDPWAGFLYAYRDRFLLQVAYPESRLEWSPASPLRFQFGARLLRWPEYSLGDDDARARVQYEEARVFGGVEIGSPEGLAVALQGGYLLDRTFMFEASSPDVELEDAGFVTIGLRGRL